MRINGSSVVVFDLDDTLYKEIDFVASAYRKIAGLVAPTATTELYEEMWHRFVTKQDTFDWLVQKYASAYTIAELVDIYRHHTPQLILPVESRRLLDLLSACGAKLGVITDGRERTQMNKLHSLGIVDLFDKIIISESFGSEKPTEANYRIFETAFPGSNLFYVGDNPRKDFIAPNKLGWTTIGVADDGRNIHQQIKGFPEWNYPQFMVGSLSEIQVECDEQQSVT